MALCECPALSRTYAIGLHAAGSCVREVVEEPAPLRDPARRSAGRRLAPAAWPRRAGPLAGWQKTTSSSLRRQCSPRSRRCAAQLDRSPGGARLVESRLRAWAPGLGMESRKETEA